MQENTTKEQNFTKARRANPIHVVDTSRLATSNADALREVHMSLVRAEQNLFNLVQSNQVANGNHVGYGYPAQQAFATGLAPGFAPGFAPQGPLATPGGLAVGIPPGMGIAPAPWGAAPSALPTWQPALPAWPYTAGVSAWSPLAAGIPSAPAALQQGSGFMPATLIGNPAAYGVGIASRTPACDISDEGKQFVCQLDLPGLRADQVEVLVFEHAVVINAYREAESDLASVVQAERGTATLQRTITLPNEIQPGTAKANLSNGVLSLVLPKAHPTEGPRRIKVSG